MTYSTFSYAHIVWWLQMLMRAAGADTLSGNSRQCVVPSMTVLE